MSETVRLLFVTMERFMMLYMALIFLRILLSWFPNVNWMAQPFAALSQVTDPYLDLFRRFIPPIGMIDVSSIVAIFALQIALVPVQLLASTAIAPI